MAEHCPFCGCEDQGHDGAMLVVAGWSPDRYIKCHSCGATGPTERTVALAWAAWRERDTSLWDGNSKEPSSE